LKLHGNILLSICVLLEKDEESIVCFYSLLAIYTPVLVEVGSNFVSICL
jgi:hypothetical protein